MKDTRLASFHKLPFLSLHLRLFRMLKLFYSLKQFQNLILDIFQLSVLKFEKIRHSWIKLENIPGPFERASSFGLEMKFCELRLMYELS